MIQLCRTLMIISVLAKLDLLHQTHCNSEILFHPKMILHLFQFKESYKSEAQAINFDDTFKEDLYTVYNIYIHSGGT